MKNFLVRAIGASLILVTLLGLCSCAEVSRMAKNDVHTPYDGVNFNKYVDLAKYRVEIDKKELEENAKLQIDEFLESYADKKIVGGDGTSGIPNRAIKAGDWVTISTTAHVYGDDGVTLTPVDEFLGIDENKTTSSLEQQVIKNIGSGEYRAEIENAIIGSWTGDIEYVDITYDDTVNTEKLKNKKVRVTVTINKVEEVTMPEYGDAFIASKTVYKTVAEFEEAIKKELLKGYVWSLYVEKCKMDKYPTDRLNKFKDEITQYYTGLAENNKQTLQQYLNTKGITTETFEKGVEDQAKGTVKEEMILYYIAERENLSFTEEEYKASATELLEEYDCQSIAELEAMYTKELIERLVYWDLVKEFLYTKIKLV